MNMNQNINMQMNGQWRVVFYEVDEQPVEEIMRSFADAFALALPDPLMEPGWTSLRRAEVVAAFAAGAAEVVVARHPHGVGLGRTVIYPV